MPSELQVLIEAGRLRLGRALERSDLLAGRFAGGPDRGWAVRERSGPALEARLDGRAFRVHLAGAPGRPRFDALSGALADAILRGRAAAGGGAPDPLPVLVVRPLSDAMRARLVAYCSEVAPDLHFGLVDPERGAWLWAPSKHEPGAFDVRLEEVSERRAPEAVDRSAARGSGAFSDLGQWMLKVWLAQRIDPRWIAAPHRPIRGVRELARAARVSESQASRCVQQLERQGFVERRGRALELVRIGALLEQWSAARLPRPVDLPARFDLPAADPVEALRRRRSGAQGSASYGAGGAPRYGLGLFAAARLLGLGHVRGAPVHLLHEDPSPAALAALGLGLVRPGEAADLLVRRPRHPECAFRGVVARGGLPVADALECWLDLARHPARGEEQAQEILEAIGLPEGARS
ncbi:MAG TPA: helix-turn-helix domain-containing protein [Planctomycetota bacterium]|nr:helix-turn-helix domain-containing protein [Planctomycetota bacterium]